MIAFKNIKAEVVIKNPLEHLQRCWAKGVFYEAHKAGMLNYIYYNERIRGGKYIDIGASIGNHTIFFAKVMQGEVISFEPQSESYNHMLENIQLNGLNVEAYNVALGDKQGFVTMVAKAENNVGMYEVQEGGTTSLHTLDMYADRVRGYDVMKIDIENYNKQLLTGAKNVLIEGTGNVYIEADNLPETDAIMKQYGYNRIKDLVFNHTPTYLYTKW